MMLLGVHLLFALHAIFHLWCVCGVFILHVFGSDVSLSIVCFNWLITMVTVLWKSSVPTTLEMPSAHLNVIFACCLHFSCPSVCQSFEYCLFDWIMFSACLCCVLIVTKDISCGAAVVVVLSCIALSRRHTLRCHVVDSHEFGSFRVKVLRSCACVVFIHLRALFCIIVCF